MYLLDRVVSYGRLGTGIRTNHTALVSEKVPVSSLAWLRRFSAHRETNIDAAGRERSVNEIIAALRGCGGLSFRQHIVDQARLGRGWRTIRSAGSTVRSNIVQFRGEADWNTAGVPVSSLVRDLTSCDGANRTYGRSLVGGHTGAHQVGNSDSRDNQDDRDHNQKLNQRETLLPLHNAPLTPGRIHLPSGVTSRWLIPPRLQLAYHFCGYGLRGSTLDYPI